MSRRFREHDLRQIVSLNGVWDFAFLGEIDPDQVDVSAIPFSDRMAVPGSFDATPAYAGRRGLVAYRTRVPVKDDASHRVIFDSVHHWCRVFADGQPLRDHSGGYTQFEVDVPNPRPGEMELVVLVDNRFDYERCPLHLEYFDWYHYGGITRPVEWHRLGASWIDGIRVVTEGLDPPTIALSVAYRAVAPPEQTQLMITWGDQVLLSEAVNLSETSGQLERTLELPGAALWSPSAPNLHLLHARLGEDDQRIRIGLRQIAVKGKEITINGEPVRLLGFCRHETHPQFGPALPEGVMVADVQQLLDLGCNFVRGSHYPQDLRFLDLCDEAGICVWNEAIGWQHTAEHLADTHFINAQLAHIDEMVAMSFNHPSVIMWGILNESHSHDLQCRPGYETLLGRLRQLDPTRPVTYACNHPFEDVCLDLVDIVSINGYPGWYRGEIDEIPQNIDAVFDHLVTAGHGDKPLIVSEIGAGAIPGWRDINQTRWSEGYQARLLDVVIRHLFLERDDVSGLSIWQFCDGRTSEAVYKILGRPRGFNNKGVVDEYRRPKQAYEVVKRHFHELE